MANIVKPTEVKRETGPAQKPRQTIEMARDRVVFDPPVVTVTGSVPLRMGWLISVPNKPGIYFIADFRGILYIGKTDDLQRRFREHYCEKSNRRLVAALNRPLGVVTFSWQSVSIEGLDAVERAYIDAFKPLCNSNHLNF